MRVADMAAELSKVAVDSSRLSAYTHDLSSLAEVRALAEEVKRDHPIVNVLVNNAGVFETSERCAALGPTSCVAAAWCHR